MITDPTRALAWMVGLDDVTFLGLDPGEVTTVHVESVRATGRLRRAAARSPG